MSKKPRIGNATRCDKQCPKCKEWELNDMGICNACGYRVPSK